MVDIQRYEGLVESIERQKQEIGERASVYPTREEYVGKDTEERLGAAKDILAKYTGDDKWAGATIGHEDQEHPGVTLEARVRYGEKRDITERVGIPERIIVNAFAQDAANGLRSDTRVLGQLREGAYTDEEGEPQQGWHVFRLQSDFRLDEGDTLTLQSQLGQDMVEMVDAAVLGLIDGVISDQRRFIGGQAIEGAVQPTAEA
jgi:hypothetical protein